MPVATQIRNAIVTEIRKIAGVDANGSDFFTTFDQITRFPAVFTLLEADEKVRAPTRSKEVTARYRNVCVLRSDAPEDDFDVLAAGIENQVEDDPTLGGLALDAWVSSRGSFATAKSIAGQLYIRDVFVEVLYRHARAAA